MWLEYDSTLEWYKVMAVKASLSVSMWTKLDLDSSGYPNFGSECGLSLFNIFGME